jgi:hypothetical protein
MADRLQDTLAPLQELAALLPDRVEAIAQEAEAVQTVVRDFLRGLDERQAEAGALFARVEAALAEVRREGDTSLDLRIGIGGGVGIDAPAEVLTDPALAMDDKLFEFTNAALSRHGEAVEGMRARWTRDKESERTLLLTAASQLASGVQAGGDRLESAHEETVLEGAGLRGTIQASRESLATEMERLAAEIADHRAQADRDIEEMVKDVGALEAALLARLERNREAIRIDADRIEEETQRRLDEMVDIVDEALQGVGRANRALHDLLKQTEQESDRARRELNPQFKALATHIEHLKHALDSVRDAARQVGIPF